MITPIHPVSGYARERARERSVLLLPAGVKAGSSALADVSRRAVNSTLLGALPDLNIEVSDIVDDLRDERATR